MRKIIFITVTSLFLPFTLQGSESGELKKISLEDKKCPYTEKQKNEFASDIVNFYFQKNIKNYNRLSDQKMSLDVSALALTLDKSIFNKCNFKLDDFIMIFMPFYTLFGKKCTSLIYYRGLVTIIKEAVQKVMTCDLIFDLTNKYFDEETYYALIDISAGLFFVNYLHAKGVELLPFYQKTISSFDDIEDQLSFHRMFKIVGPAVNPKFHI